MATPTQTQTQTIPTAETIYYDLRDVQFELTDDIKSKLRSIPIADLSRFLTPGKSSGKYTVYDKTGKSICRNFSLARRTALMEFVLELGADPVGCRVYEEEEPTLTALLTKYGRRELTLKEQKARIKNKGETQYERECRLAVAHGTELPPAPLPAEPLDTTQKTQKTCQYCKHVGTGHSASGCWDAILSAAESTIQDMNNTGYTLENYRRLQKFFSA